MAERLFVRLDCAERENGPNGGIKYKITQSFFLYIYVFCCCCCYCYTLFVNTRDMNVYKSMSHEAFYFCTYVIMWALVGLLPTEQNRKKRNLSRKKKNKMLLKQNIKIKSHIRIKRFKKQNQNWSKLSWQFTLHVL